MKSWWKTEGGELISYPPGYPIGVSPRKVSIKWHLLKTHLFLLSFDFANKKTQTCHYCWWFQRIFLVCLSRKQLVKSCHLWPSRRICFSKMGGDYLTHRTWGVPTNEKSWVHPSSQTVTTRMTWNIWIGNWRSRSLNLLHFPLLLLGLGGGRSKRNLMFRWRTFKDFWHFSPWTLGEMIQFDLCIFLNWVETTNQWSVE